MSTITWIEAPVAPGLEVRQVYGFIFDLDGRILLLEDEGQYNLPGGKPEGDETIVETLVRESLEECQATIESSEYLGYQLIEGHEKFAQVRFAALIRDLFPAAPDPITGKQYKRLWVPPLQVNELLKWGDSGDGQIRCAISKYVYIYPDGMRGV